MRALVEELTAEEVNSKAPWKACESLTYPCAILAAID